MCGWNLQRKVSGRYIYEGQHWTTPASATQRPLSAAELQKCVPKTLCQPHAPFSPQSLPSIHQASPKAFWVHEPRLVVFPSPFNTRFLSKSSPRLPLKSPICRQALLITLFTRRSSPLTCFMSFPTTCHLQMLYCIFILHSLLQKPTIFFL